MTVSLANFHNKKKDIMVRHISVLLSPLFDCSVFNISKFRKHIVYKEPPPHLNRSSNYTGYSGIYVSLYRKQCVGIVNKVLMLSKHPP